MHTHLIDIYIIYYIDTFFHCLYLEFCTYIIYECVVLNKIKCDFNKK